MPAFAAAMFGLQVGSMLLGGSNQAKSSRAGIRANDMAIKELNDALGTLDDSALAKGELAEFETKNSLQLAGENVSRQMTDIHKKGEELSGKQGFSFAGETQESISQITDKMQDEFLNVHGESMRGLDKQVAGIEEWRKGEELRLGRERKKLQLENKRLRDSSSIWKALGF